MRWCDGGYTTNLPLEDHPIGVPDGCPRPAMLVADSATDGRVMPAVLAGASGLVTEGVGPREPVRVVCAVADGGTVLPTGIGDRLAAAYRESGA